MRLIICISTFNRNDSLKECIKSINKIINKDKIIINIIITDNSKNDNISQIKKQLIKISKYKILFLKEKKRGIVNSRNKSLKALKNINPDYISLFDDDCTVDKYWIKNAFKIIKFNKADVATGPQIYLGDQSNKIINYSEIFEKQYSRNKTQLVKWAASNNVIIDYKIIKKHNLLFNTKLNKFGVGEDQLFFSNISKKGYKIYWDKSVKVYEKTHKHRQTFKWLIERSFRLGVLGHFLDINYHGKVYGFFINYLKSIYYLFKFIISIFILGPNYYEKIVNNFLRFYGRLIGPFVFSRIDFYKN